MNEKELFSQGTYNFERLRIETLAIADHLYVKSPKACFLQYNVIAKRRQHIVYLE